MSDSGISILVTSAIISGIISLGVSWIMLTISNSKNAKIKLKDSIYDGCNEIHRIVCKKDPELYESDVIFCVNSMMQTVKTAKLIPEKSKENHLDNIRKIKYQFTSLTRSDLDTKETSKSKEKIEDTFLSIKQEIEDI